ncbi:hypothetical protein [Paracoccus sediminilitoris]|uniref:hypothetical protein n=1 Tax=Paracoccus sediminilitoris TaxID=2202419 RepID=UPI000DB9FDC4|nr:hypothetical protein [Paracoccus sediminilitoris]
MPNYARREQEILTAEHQALMVKSRAPDLGLLADADLLALLEQLRVEKALVADDPAGNPADGGLGPAQLLAAAIKRVDLERRKRGIAPGMAAGSANAGRTPITPKAVATTRRRAAATPRKPAGRKSAEARKTDLRTEPHRVPKQKAKRPAAPIEADAEDAMVTRNSKMPLTDTEKAAKKAARKAEKEATKAAEKDAAREARRAERKALKDAEKEQARAERKAERKAEKDAAQKAEKQAERAERKAGRKSAVGAEITPAALKTQSAEKPKSDKPKTDTAKTKAAKAPKPKTPKDKPPKNKGAAAKKAK